MKTISNYIILLSSCTVFIFSHCGSNNTETPQKPVLDTKNDASIDTAGRSNIAKNILFSIPTPSQIAAILKESGSTYNVMLMNDPNLEGDYVTVQKMAINLGIYGADLNYANVFEKNMEKQLYLQCCQNLVNRMGLDAAVSENVWDRLESNQNDIDSISSIASEVYLDIDYYLEQNKKQELSALIIAGGWLEGLYLAVSCMDETKPNQKLLERIAEQKLSLAKIVRLINTYPKTDAITSLAADLDRLTKAYEAVVYEVPKNTAKTNAQGITEINGKAVYEIKPETFKSIKEVSLELRGKYVKP